MAETYPLTLPTHTGIASLNWAAENRVAVSQSPFTLQQQVVKHAGQRWSGTYSLPAMQRENAEVWNAFLLRLDGSFGTFLMGDPIGATPRGSAATTAGTPVVNGASQTGHELAIDGLPVSATGYLKAGDYIQLGSGSSAKLHKVLEDVDSNASGEATLNIWPDLRSSPSDGATVAVSNAKGVFRLVDNTINWDIGSNSFYSISFAFVEAL
jgi:hypothetical protein